MNNILLTLLVIAIPFSAAQAQPDDDPKDEKSADFRVHQKKNGALRCQKKILFFWVKVKNENCKDVIIMD